MISPERKGTTENGPAQKGKKKGIVRGIRGTALE